MPVPYAPPTPRLLATAQRRDGTTSPNSAAFVDVDAANLVVAFTVPASGEVLVRLSSSVETNNTGQQWNLREGAADVANSASNTIAYGAAQQLSIHASYSVKITGLTPGSVKTWKWGANRSFGTGTCNINGPSIMEVWSI